MAAVLGGTMAGHRAGSRASADHVVPRDARRNRARCRPCDVPLAVRTLLPAVPDVRARGAGRAQRNAAGARARLARGRGQERRQMKTIVVIAAYNEAGAVGTVVREIATLGYEVLVV